MILQRPRRGPCRIYGMLDATCTADDGITATFADPLMRPRQRCRNQHCLESAAQAARCVELHCDNLLRPVRHPSIRIAAGGVVTGITLQFEMLCAALDAGGHLLVASSFHPDGPRKAASV